jgi:hypothetical protein
LIRPLKALRTIITINFGPKGLGLLGNQTARAPRNNAEIGMLQQFPKLLELLRWNFPERHLLFILFQPQDRVASFTGTRNTSLSESLSFNSRAAVAKPQQ